MYVDGFLDGKADQLFALYDADGDGFVTEADYRARAERFLSSYGVALESARGKAVVETRVALWNRAASKADVDGDGRISREEHRAWLDSTTDDDALDTVVRPAILAEFDVIDVDRDGSISQAEFATWQGLVGMTPASTASAFAVLDADGDGRITVEEYVAAVR